MGVKGVESLQSETAAGLYSVVCIHIRVLIGFNSFTIYYFERVNNVPVWTRMKYNGI